MPGQLLIEPLRAQVRFHINFARTPFEVQEAQRLRYTVFVEEQFAQLVRHRDYLEQDWLDPYCEHLLVYECKSQKVVGTCRILLPDQAKRIGGWYLETEFNLTRLRSFQSILIEVGRICIHPAYRTEPVLSLLWSWLGMYMIKHGYEYTLTSIGISLTDGGRNAAAIYSQLKDTHLSPEAWRVYPLHPFTVHRQEPINNPVLPMMIMEYLRIGASICGPPAWEPNFNAADFLFLFSAAHLALQERGYLKEECGEFED